MLIEHCIRALYGQYTARQLNKIPFLHVLRLPEIMLMANQ